MGVAAKPEVIEYLKNQRVGVLAIEMLDGSPHAATVHFAHSENPFVFYFETYRAYRKAEPLFGRETSRASFVVGADETNMKTLQLDGIAELISGGNDTAAFDKIYFRKFSEKAAKKHDEKFVAFKFTPTWWRFTDWTTKEGKTILLS